MMNSFITGAKEILTKIMKAVHKTVYQKRLQVRLNHVEMYLIT